MHGLNGLKGVTPRRKSGGSGRVTYDGDASAYFAAMAEQPTEERKRLVNDLVVRLKDATVWPRLDWLCLFASHHEQAARLNLKNPAKAMIAVNSPTFETDLGFKGNGSNAYLRIGEATSAPGNNCAQNDASAFIYKNNFNPSDGGNKRELGGPLNDVSGALNDGILISVNWTDSSPGATVALNGSDTSAPATYIRSKGLVLMSRYESSKFYVHGTTGSDQAAVNSNSSLAGDTDLYALRGNGYSNSRLAVWGFGGGMDANQAREFFKAIQAYLAPLGAL